MNPIDLLFSSPFGLLLSNIERVVGPQIIPILLFFGLASYYDIRDQKIYNWVSFSMFYYNAIVYIGIPLITKNFLTAGNSVLGGVLAFGAVMAPAMVFMIKAGGDIKFAGATGIALGGLGAASWLLVSVILVLLYGLFIKIKDGKNSWTVIPFAPFMFVGFLINVAVFAITYIILVL